MSNITVTGTFAERPAPSVYIGGYFYATDQRKYYKSNGENWVEVVPDLENIDPTTAISIGAGVADDGTIDTLKLTNNGSLKVNNTAVPGFNIPTHNKIEMTYISGTGNIETIVYKFGTTTVATLTFQYVDPAADQPLVTSVVLS